MCFLRSSIALIAAFLLSVQAAVATPDPSATVRDQLLWVGEDRFVVLRLTVLGFGSYYQLRTLYERVEISVWDGRVLERCSLGVQDAQDQNALDDWVVTETPAEPGCDAKPNETMSAPTPLLNPGARIELLDGSLLVRANDRESVLADAAFVTTRLQAMTEAERLACEADRGEPWISRFGGCNLAQDLSACRADHTAWATAERVFFQVVCEEDIDGSRTWLTVGRAFWDAQVE